MSDEKASVGPAVFAYITSMFSAFMLLSSAIPLVIFGGVVGWITLVVIQLSVSDDIIKSHVSRARKSISFHTLWCFFLFIMIITGASWLIGLSMLDIQYVSSGIEQHGIEVLDNEIFWEGLPLVQTHINDDPDILAFSGMTLFFGSIVVAGVLNFFVGGISLIRNILGIMKLSDRRLA